MAIVPHTAHPIHPRTAPLTGHRWPYRIYPGDLGQTSRVRSDLAADLAQLAGLAGLDQETRENMVLCASEMFANASAHSRSGQDPEGRVIRTLHRPTATTIQVAIVDDGTRTDTVEPHGPQIPHQRTLEEWQEAERGRGLLLIHHLATRWGTRPVVAFPFCAGLGTVTWAEFTLDGGQR